MKFDRRVQYIFHFNPKRLKLRKGNYKISLLITVYHDWQLENTW